MHAWIQYKTGSADESAIVGKLHLGQTITQVKCSYCMELLEMLYKSVIHCKEGLQLMIVSLNI